MSSANWKPKVLGAYLNGVWASAAETLTRELVGSSQGEPNLTLFLARPPVLRNTLELRVKEPLGEEERKALNDERADQVLSAVENLPGDWVLWKRVIDPADEEPTARVYALDEATGEIRFGDGRHGAFRRWVATRSWPSRIGAPSRAPDSTASTARCRLTSCRATRSPRARRSISSLPSRASRRCSRPTRLPVARLPEDVDRVLRFGVARLRHRERALTARDIEDLVLESSPDIAQARCFAAQRLRAARRRDARCQSHAERGAGARAAPAAGGRSAAGAERAAGSAHRWTCAPPPARRPATARREPRRRRRGRARGSGKQIIALFDTATGGADKEGWALGENPSEADVALALANVPHLEGIAAVDLREIAATAAISPGRRRLKRNELARLEKDGVRIEFETVEVIA